MAVYTGLVMLRCGPEQRIVASPMSVYEEKTRVGSAGERGPHETILANGRYPDRFGFDS